MSRFQQTCEARLDDALSRNGIVVTSRSVHTELADADRTATVIEKAVGKLQLWIHENEAFIGGATTAGETIDDRFESSAFRDDDALIAVFVDQVLHYLAGGTSKITGPRR